MSTTLEKEFDYYLANQTALVEKYRGRYVVIKNENVIGVYDSEIEAVRETGKTHDIGTFLVQRCEPGEDSYSLSYHSRVAFA